MRTVPAHRATFGICGRCRSYSDFYRPCRRCEGPAIPGEPCGNRGAVGHVRDTDGEALSTCCGVGEWEPSAPED